LQTYIGVAADGAIGEKTLAAINQFENQALIDLINGYCDSRQAFLAGLPTFATFGKGWTARVERLRAEAVELAGQSRP
jgi:lysozyme family protein